MKNHLLLPTVYTVIGVLIVFSTLIYSVFANQEVTPSATVISEFEAHKTERSPDNQPIHLTISSLVNSSIEPAFLVENQPGTSANTASHLYNSAFPGENGNIIIYGHNKKEILGNLKAVDVDQMITLTLANGEQRQYQILEIIQVNTDQTQYLEPTDQEILTIYTCDGWLDQKRLIVRAEPVENDQSVETALIDATLH